MNEWVINEFSMDSDDTAELPSAEADLDEGYDDWEDVETDEEEQHEMMIEKQERVKEKLQTRCSQGYEWLKEGSGYRCVGGTHYVSSKELEHC